MPIEFYCSACGAYLRAPDARAGLAISCPHCFAGVWIPTESEHLEFVDEETWETTEEESILDSEDIPFLGYEEVELLFKEPEEIDLSRILGDTWRIFSENWKACYTVTVVDSALTIVAFFVSFLFGAIASMMVARNPGAAILAGLIVFGLGFAVMMSMFAVGHIRFYLELCRNENPEIKNSVNFQGPVGGMLFGGIIFWGLFLLIFPPIFLWPYGRVLIDKKSTAFRSLLTSLKFTTKHSGVCFALIFVKIGAIFVSALIPIVGTIIITPYLATLNTVAYLHFTGEFE